MFKVMLCIIFLLFLNINNVQTGISIKATFAQPQDIKIFSNNQTIKCEEVEKFDYHIHSLLTIIVNKTNQTIPEGIGILPSQCIFWLHTHDDSGLIHIESPTKENFTLGQFFDVWKYSAKENYVQSPQDVIILNEPVKIYKNNNELKNSTINKVILQDKDDIVLLY